MLDLSLNLTEGGRSSSRRSNPPSGPASSDDYKLTAVLRDDEYRALDAITQQVLDVLRPRRYGRGWYTKVIRASIRMLASDPKLVRRLIEFVRDLPDR